MALPLQELILRGRLVFSHAPERLKVFELVNGKRSTKEIASVSRRHINNVRRDIRIITDAGLIQPVLVEGRTLRKKGSPVFEKLPLARTLSTRYFQATAALPRPGPANSASQPTSKRQPRRPGKLAVPTGQEVLQIARQGEDQLHEFKGQGTDIRKITREIAAMLNTSRGGIVFYGIDDEGGIEGSDLTRQEMDQRLQNSVKNSIAPAATVRISSVNILGSNIVAVVVPPWDRKSVYQFDEKILIRKGTNVFAAKPEELRLLHQGKPIV
jgi:predicted HTH transcriptional regulator